MKIENYTVIDIETTGLSPNNDDIIELSGLKVRNNCIVKEFSTLVKSKKSINYFISNLTGITNKMIENAPSIVNVLPQFKNFISDDIILGHNVSFDIRFIKNKLNTYCSDCLKNQSLDTMKIAKSTVKLTSYKLTSLADYFNIDTKNNHRGLKDCYITYEVYKNLLDSMTVSK